MTLGNIIKQYRSENSLSMEEFAKRCSLSKGYISMIENGINPRNNKPIAPTLPSISRIASAMNLELDELLKIMDGGQQITLIHQKQEDAYYPNDEVREAAQFLFDNPEYRVLFDATRKVKPEDIQFVKEMLDRFNKE